MELTVAERVTGLGDRVGDAIARRGPLRFVMAHPRTSIGLTALVLSAVLIGFATAIGDVAGGWISALLACILAAYAIRQLGPGSGKTLIRETNARPADEAALRHTVSALDDMAIAAGLPRRPALFIFDCPALNAWVFGSTDDSSVGVSSAVLERFSPDEQRAVFAGLVARLDAGVVRGGPKRSDVLDGLFHGFTGECFMFASDEKALLLLRDPGPLLSALAKAAQGSKRPPGRVNSTWWPYMWAEPFKESRWAEHTSEAARIARVRALSKPVDATYPDCAAAAPALRDGPIDLQ